MKAKRFLIFVVVSALVLFDGWIVGIREPEPEMHGQILVQSEASVLGVKSFPLATLTLLQRELASDLNQSAIPLSLSPLRNIEAITAGSSHTCALTAGGGIKCWGHNVFGQLGDGTRTSRSTPVDVIDLSSGIRAVAAGGSHTCALTMEGGVKCWGRNQFGQLGDGTITHRSTPVNVVGLSRGVKAIAAGGEHTCALTEEGGVVCWGNNAYGQLGDGSTSNSRIPVDVVGLSRGVKAIAAGDYHTCALTEEGKVKCWGDNRSGQLGDGTWLYSRRTPVDVISLPIGIKSIAAGSAHTCALTVEGKVKCWGNNSYGQLGDGTTTSRNTPTDVADLTIEIKTVATGGAYTCALTVAGQVKCWGNNSYGQLGDGTTTSRNTPVDVVGLSSGIKAIAAGGSHTCALTAEGSIKCWGNNWSGELGDGTALHRSEPTDTLGLSSRVENIATGGYHTCALTESKVAKCWGENAFGQLGDGTTTHRSTPVDVESLSGRTEAVAAGLRHTCALTERRGVKCWGNNWYGQLGDGTLINKNTPVDVVGLSSGIKAVAAGGSHTCALTEEGSVKCWGNNRYGQLGDGTTTHRSTPVNVEGLSSEIKAIAAGDSHTCALTTGGGVKCWGNNNYGQLGDRTTTNRSTPVDVEGLSSGVETITAGDFHTCAVTTGGEVKCWGYNGTGQLGIGTTAIISSPVPLDVVGLSSGAQSIAAGALHTCALIGGGAKCWGSNWYGQLGIGTTAIISSPVPLDVVGLSSGAQAVATGALHTCALIVGGVKCWGYNWYGQLGDGRRFWSTMPVDVVTPVWELYLPLVVSSY